MEASSMHSTSVSENLRVLLVCTPAHMGCYDISIVTRYFKSWICLHAACKIGDSGSSILCYFQMKRGNCIGTRRILVFKRRIYYSEAFCVQRCFDWFLQFFWRWSFRARTGCELYGQLVCYLNKINWSSIAQLWWLLLWAIAHCLYSARPEPSLVGIWPVAWSCHQVAGILWPPLDQPDSKSRHKAWIRFYSDRQLGEWESRVVTAPQCLGFKVHTDTSFHLKRKCKRIPREPNYPEAAI